MATLKKVPVLDETGQAIVSSINNLTNVVSSSDYTKLANKPKLGNITIDGTKSLDDYGIQSKLVNQESIKSINGISLLGGGNISVTTPTFSNITGGINDNSALASRFSDVESSIESVSSKLNAKSISVTNETVEIKW